MKTIIKIAWRNIWRNRLRSSIVIVSMVLGIWSGLFLMGMTLGLNDQRMNSAVETYLSHAQVHHPDFIKNQRVQDTIIGYQELMHKIQKSDIIRGVTSRTISYGMIANAKGSHGIQINGIHPDQEKSVTNIHTTLVEGTYFTKFKKNPILVGAKLAKKMKLKVKSKIVMTIPDIDGNMVTNSFRVEGIFNSRNSIIDGMNVFIRHKDHAKSINLIGQYHEVAVLGKSMKDDLLLKEELTISDQQKYKVESWKEIAPELAYAEEIMGTFIFIFMFIILIALAFGIVNAMLMAILERKRELGMLMSVGMNKKKVFAMISFETIFIALVATPIGLILAYSTIQYFGKHGINLAIFKDGLQELGIGAILYTHLPNNLYFTITALTIAVAFVSSLIPARKALQLNPAEAVKSL